MHRFIRGSSRLAIGLTLVALAGLLLGACADDGRDGSNGRNGSDGANGASTGTIAGTVENDLTQRGVAGATITLNPAVAGVTIVTDANGGYSATVPVGAYAMTATATNFVKGETAVSVTAGQKSTKNIDLVPVAPVIVKIDASGIPSPTNPGSSFPLVANATAMDGSSVLSYLWTQTNSVDVDISSPTAPTTSVTLPNSGAYLTELYMHVEELDRWGVQGVSPYALEETGMVTLQVAVTTTTGTWTSNVAVHAHLDFVAINPGLQNVPVGLPVLMQGRDQPTWNWQMTGKPATSAATLNNGTTRHPWFQPDVAGKYTLTTVDDEEGVVTLEIYAGTWQGAISGIGADGKPDSASCTGCHNGGIAPDNFTEWRESGHAHIFTDNLNTGGHYSSGCFSCHTVGFDGAANNGFDNSPSYSDFLADFFPGGNSHPDPDNWEDLVSMNEYQHQWSRANIQCENCHGPNNSQAHMILGEDDPRTSLSSDVCATCHGEPPRHARFQQWELSAHANFELAIDEGTSGSCSRCHSANGFLAWEKAGWSKSSVNVTWDESDIQPQTCTACHKTHNPGTMSSDDNDVNLRIQGDSPALLAGFTAYGMGNGALCITCHNTRRGLANDSVGLVDAANPDQAPHGGAQGDVFMGQNAFYVDTGYRGAHANIEDTCTKCHLEVTDPPADLSYSLGGTNHTFYASPKICGECHGAFDGVALMENNENALHALADEIKRAIEAEIWFQLDQGNEVTVAGADSEDEDTANDIEATIDDESNFEVLELIESHGRSAMNIVIDGVTIHHARLGSDTDVNDGETSIGDLLDNSVEGNNGIDLAKLNWNYWLLHSDGSAGVHNPSWVNAIIVNSMKVLTANWPEDDS